MIPVFLFRVSFAAGHVGPPLPCNKIKLVDVPEMECYAKDGKGEVRMSVSFFLFVFALNFISVFVFTIPLLTSCLSPLLSLILIGSFVVSRARFAFTGRMCSRDTCMTRKRQKKLLMKTAGFTQVTWENGSR